MNKRVMVREVQMPHGAYEIRRFFEFLEAKLANSFDGPRMGRQMFAVFFFEGRGETAAHAVELFGPFQLVHVRQQRFFVGILFHFFQVQLSVGNSFGC